MCASCKIVDMWHASADRNRVAPFASAVAGILYRSPTAENVPPAWSVQVRGIIGACRLKLGRDLHRFWLARQLLHQAALDVDDPRAADL